MNTQSTDQPNFEEGGCIARRFANYCITTDRPDCQGFRYPRFNRDKFKWRCYAELNEEGVMAKEQGSAIWHPSRDLIV